MAYYNNNDDKKDELTEETLKHVIAGPFSYEVGKEYTMEYGVFMENSNNDELTEEELENVRAGRRR